MFTGADDGLLLRSNFRRRVCRPPSMATSNQWVALHLGVHFHDLRHAHKTRLIENGVPEVAMRTPRRQVTGVRGTYSHVTQAMIDALLVGPQRVWEQAASTKNGDRYPATSVVKINCSPIAPATTEGPAGDDHRQQPACVRQLLIVDLYKVLFTP